MKPGVFTQIYIQLVFAIKNREALLINEYQKEGHFHMASLR